MSAFPFTVGDKVRRPEWDEGNFVTITAVGECYFLAQWPMLPPAYECSYDKSETWFRYGAVAA